MKRLTVAQRVQVVRGLNRLGENPLGEIVAAGYLYLAETEDEAAQIEQLHAVEPLTVNREQFAFSLTPKGRAALDSHEGA